MIGRIIHWFSTGDWLQLPKMENCGFEKWRTNLSFGTFEVVSTEHTCQSYIIRYRTNIGEFYRDLSDFGGMRQDFKVYVSGSNIEASQEISNAIREYNKRKD